MKRIILISSVIIAMFSFGCATEPENNTENSQFQIFESPDQIHVLSDDAHFASYLYDTALLKPVLFPVYSPSNIRMQRLFPLKRVAGENHDHPHHAGVFFTYGSEGEVNGNNFWAGQQALTNIRHIGVTRKEINPDNAILGTLAHWIGSDGNVLLEEERTMIFSGDQTERAIDFTFILKGRDEDVVFEDTKEGMFAIRVAQWLNEQGGSGKYLSSEGGMSSEDIWGTRAKWVRLEGRHEGMDLGIIILNHPSSVNYPTYWHARGYGLFAANPLGQSVFQETRGLEDPEPLNYTIAAGESAVFKFKMIIYEGRRTAEQIEEVFEDYSL